MTLFNAWLITYYHAILSVQLEAMEIIKIKVTQELVSIYPTNKQSCFSLLPKLHNIHPVQTYQNSYMTGSISFLNCQIER